MAKATKRRITPADISLYDNPGIPKIEILPEHWLLLRQAREELGRMPKGTAIEDALNALWIATEGALESNHNKATLLVTGIGSFSGPGGAA
jgi:hypothetical protein